MNRPLRQTWENLLYDRSLTIDHSQVFAYQPPYDNRDDGRNNFEEAAVRGVYCKDKLTNLYFSDENITNVDKQLRYAIYKLSKGKFSLGPQNRTELFIIMRSIFFQYAQNQPCNIKNQIKELNDIVIKEAAPRLLSNTAQYVYYLERANEGHRQIIPRPVNINKTGLKVLDPTSALGF